MKFGGTSVADLDKIANAAKKVVQEVGNGHDVIVIVSAMSGKTNELVNWVKETKEDYDQAEYDAVVSSGENITSGLMALRLQQMGVPARSWQGWQVPVQATGHHESARIDAIPTAVTYTHLTMPTTPLMDIYVHHTTIKQNAHHTKIQPLFHDTDAVIHTLI